MVMILKLLNERSKFIGAGLSTTGLAGAGAGIGKNKRGGLFSSKILEDFKRNEPNFEVVSASLSLILLYTTLYLNSSVWFIVIFVIMHEFLATLPIYIKKKKVAILVSIKMLMAGYYSIRYPFLFTIEFSYATSAIFAIIVYAFKEGNLNERGVVLPFDNLVKALGFKGLNESQLRAWGEFLGRIGIPAIKKVGVISSIAGTGGSLSYLFAHNERKSRESQTNDCLVEAKILETKSNHTAKLRDDHVIDYDTANKSLLEDKVAMDYVQYKIKNIKTPGDIISNTSNSIYETFFK
jgi:hypothetical protein